MALASTSFGFTITGQDGQDADDTLIGSTKPDTLVDHEGSDTLTAGDGADVFDMSDANAGIATSGNGNLGVADVEAFAVNHVIEFANGNPDLITDWTDGTDTIDTGSTNNITYIVAGGDVETLTTGQNYAIQGSFSGNDFTHIVAAGATGDDALVFHAKHADLFNSANKLFIVEGARDDLAAADFV